MDLIVRPHPLEKRKIYQHFPPKDGEKARDYLKRAGCFSPNALVYLDGIKMNLDTVIPKGAQVGVIQVPAGGGDGSDPIRVILTIIVIAAIIVFGPGTGSFLAAVGTGLLVAGGHLAINAILGPPEVPKPELPQVGADEKRQYSISAGRNRPRLYQPMLLVLGTHRVFPDYGAQAYTLYEGNEQFLYQTFNYGFGDLNITERKIGTTDVDEYEEVDREIEIGGHPDNVAEDIQVLNVGALLQGQITCNPSDRSITPSLDACNTRNMEAISEVVRTLPANTYEIQTNITAALTALNPDDGLSIIMTQRMTFEIKPAGSNTWTTARDLWIRNGSGQRHVFTSPSTPRFPPETDVVKHLIYGGPGAGTQLPHRFTEKIADSESHVPDLSGADLRIRVLAGLGPVRGVNETRDIHVQSINCLQSVESGVTYAGQTREGLVIQASGQLNNVIDQYHALVEQQLPASVGTALGKATINNSNPAAIFYWLLKGEFDGNQRLFGGGVADERIDTEILGEWYDFCETEGLSFNHVVAGEVELVALLRTVARAGRGSPAVIGNKIAVVWDKPTGVVSSAFNSGNILRGTFSRTFSNEVALADQVAADWIDPTNDWNTSTVRVTKPGVDRIQRIASIRLTGVTNEAQARKAANLALAENEFHNSTSHFEVADEGALLERGDTVLLAEPHVDQAGRLMGWDGTNRILTLDKQALLGEDDEIVIIGRDTRQSYYPATGAGINDVEVTTDGPLRWKGIAYWTPRVIRTGGVVYRVYGPWIPRIVQVAQFRREPNYDPVDTTVVPTLYPEFQPDDAADASLFTGANDERLVMYLWTNGLRVIPTPDAASEWEAAIANGFTLALKFEVLNGATNVFSTAGHRNVVKSRVPYRYLDRPTYLFALNTINAQAPWTFPIPAALQTFLDTNTPPNNANGQYVRVSVALVESASLRGDIALNIGADYEGSSQQFVLGDPTGGNGTMETTSPGMPTDFTFTRQATLDGTYDFTPRLHGGTRGLGATPGFLWVGGQITNAGVSEARFTSLTRDASTGNLTGTTDNDFTLTPTLTDGTFQQVTGMARKDSHFWVLMRFTVSGSTVTIPFYFSVGSDGLLTRDSSKDGAQISGSRHTAFVVGDRIWFGSFGGDLDGYTIAADGTLTRDSSIDYTNPLSGNFRGAFVKNDRVWLSQIDGSTEVYRCWQVSAAGVFTRDADNDHDWSSDAGLNVPVEGMEVVGDFAYTLQSGSGIDAVRTYSIATSGGGGGTGTRTGFLENQTIDDPQQVKWQILKDGEPGKVRITQIEPRIDGTHRITARPFNPDYYEAANRLSVLERVRTFTEPQVRNVRSDQYWIFRNGQYRRTVQVLFEVTGDYTGARIYGTENEVLGILQFSTRHTFDLPADFEGEYVIRIVPDLGRSVSHTIQPLANNVYVPPIQET